MKPKVKEYLNEAYIILDEKTDYLNFVTRSSTKEQRREFNIGDIFINSAVCTHCKDYVRSVNQHDYRECSCGTIAVDGGSWYARRAFKKPSDFIDVVEYFYDSTDDESSPSV